MSRVRGLVLRDEMGWDGMLDVTGTCTGLMWEYRDLQVGDNVNIDFLFINL